MSRAIRRLRNAAKVVQVMCEAIRPLIRILVDIILAALAIASACGS